MCMLPHWRTQPYWKNCKLSYQVKKSYRKRTFQDLLGWKQGLKSDLRLGESKTTHEGFLEESLESVRRFMLKFFHKSPRRACILLILWFLNGRNWHTWRTIRDVRLDAFTVVELRFFCYLPDEQLNLEFDLSLDIMICPTSQVWFSQSTYSFSCYQGVFYWRVTLLSDKKDYVMLLYQRKDWTLFLLFGSKNVSGST